jgi:DNA modification methylase
MVKNENNFIDYPEVNMNKFLFPFQKYILRKALLRGKYAIFADCGLGKTIIQLDWARVVSQETCKPVLILAPLAVSGQTIEEGTKFSIQIEKYHDQKEPGIYITNYEQIDNIDCNLFGGIVLDESSILKNYTGIMKNKIIDNFAKTEFKLACTATPAPNDLNELGNHSEFLNVMDSADMRMRWFVRDEGINAYRLKGHAYADFCAWISSWATVIRLPGDIGFSNDGYLLPELKIEEHCIETPKKDNGSLFNDTSVSATEFNRELRLTITERMNKAIDIANSNNESYIVWINQNIEEDYLKNKIHGCVCVRGDEKPDIKEQKLLDFAHGKYRVLVTKKKIAQFGMNFQNCHNQIFASLDFSFEGLYQAIRRSYRFGQKENVKIHLITTDTMLNVKESIDRKQKQFNDIMKGITMAVNESGHGIVVDYSGKTYKGEGYEIVNGDSVELIDSIPDNSIDLSVFSPPFSTLFTYSDNIRDMGNCVSDEEFFQQTDFLLKKMYKKIKPGRLVCVHTKDIARYKNSSGYSGMYDFTGDYHRAMERAGFRYHSKITIFNDPVLEMQRTKTQRLLYKQLTSDSSYSGIGMPDYVTIFRKWEGNEDEWEPVINNTKENFDLDKWQEWASPVWMNINKTNVLNNYRQATDERDEKHICPLQIDVIERCITLWSNPGELIFTPFLGIGSEVYQALKMGRRGIGFELKESYFETAHKNILSVIEQKKQLSLFDTVAQNEQRRKENGNN